MAERDYDAFIAKFHFSGEFSIIESTDDITSEFRITGINPNPFNPNTTISFYIPHSGNITFSVYSITGQKVREILINFNEKGLKQIMFDGKDNSGNPLSCGIYAVYLKSGKYMDSRKILLLK
jgi:hypothetical protein